MTARFLNILGFCTVVAVLSTGYIIEFSEGFQPCPLCTMQRICFAIIGCLFFVNIFLYRIKYLAAFMNFLTCVMSTIGVLLAGRQIWLQTLPPSGECGMSFQYMLQSLPLHEALINTLHGTADCAERGWDLFSFNLAQWSFICFAFLMLLSLYLWARRS